MLPMRPCTACGFEHPERVVICPSTQQVIGAAVLGGRYRLDKLIAVGGIGAVYDARALHIDRRVAVKRLLPAYTSDPEVVRRFQREARAAGRIEHPNVVEVLDFGVGEDGIPFLVMEFLEGDTLAAHIERAPGQRIPYEELLPLVLDVLEALGHAHSRGIVHRDLKPENIFLAHRANDTVVTKLVDLGISKAIGSTSQAITQSGSALGTPHYMAPEQLRGEKDVDGRVDVYALGIVMYRALSGAFPFDGRTFEHLVTRILDGTCAPLSSVVPGLPAGISQAVAWAMNRDRDQRAPSAEAFAQVLAPFSPAPVRVSTQPRVPASRSSSLPATASAPSYIPPTTPRTPAHGPSTPPQGGPEPTTTKRPSTGGRREPFRVATAEEIQASATLPVVAASAPPPKSSGGRALWLVIVVLLLAAGAVAAYLALRDGTPEQPSPPPPTGGLAGSPHADYPSTGPADAEADGPAPATDAGLVPPVPALDASVPPPPPADAALPLPPADANAEAVRAEAALPRDATVAQDAARTDTTAPRETTAVQDAARPDIAPAERDALDTAVIDAAPREEATWDTAVSPDAGLAPDTAPPSADTASGPDAGPALPTVEEIARVFQSKHSLVARCAEGEGAGEFRVEVRVRGSDGRVRDVTVTTGFSTTAQDCARNLVAGLSFPPFGDPSATFDHTYAVSGVVEQVDVGPDASLQQQVEAEIDRLRPLAKGCIRDVTTPVTLQIRADGRTRRATLVSVEGDVTAEQRACLEGVITSANVPEAPGSMTRSVRLR